MPIVFKGGSAGSRLPIPARMISSGEISKALLVMKNLLLSFIFTSAVCLSFADDHSGKLPVEADYYPITTIPLRGEVIEVSGIERPARQQGRHRLSARGYFRGRAFSGGTRAPWTLFARGLHEVLGIAWKDGYST